MVGWRAKLGFVMPAGTPTVEPEMYGMAPAGVSVHFARMKSLGATGTLEGLEARIDMQIAHMDETVELLSMIRPDVIALAHTATSYRLGVEGEKAMAARLLAKTKVPFISAFGSVVTALRHLEVKCVALATPYDERLTLLAKANLEAHGFQVVAYDWLRGVRSIFEEPPIRAYGIAKRVDRPEAQAVFISGVGLHTVSVLGALDSDLGKPVISSAGAMMWNALRTAGVSPRLPGYGRLFETG